MPNPITFLTPALDLLGANLNILPATGGAVEDLPHPAVDEVEDAIINREVVEVTAFAERVRPCVLRRYVE